MYNADKLTSIDLGRQGENLARTVEIDVSGMLTQWPDAVITLLVKRKHDAEPYIADTTVKDGVLFWPITTVETADAGDGKLEIRATCGEVIAKSATGSFRVTASLTGSGTEPPATEQGWVEKVLAAGAGVEQSAKCAIEAADRAEAAAETAESSIAQVQSAAQTATEKAKEAEDSAEAARAASANSAASTQAAQEARVGAEEAKTTAASSASAAEQAKDAAEAAQKAAAAQAAAAEEAAQAADTSAQEAQTSANAAAASEQEAKSSEAVAEQSAQAASDAKGQAESARDNAKASEKAAASSATAAKASAEAADGSATAASDASTEALERLNAAEAARDAAQTAQKAAGESAAQAEQSAVKAGEAAQAALGILDDAVTATDSTWSSQRIADVLCTPFEMSGNPITCHPVEGSPLSVVASWDPRQHFEWQSKEAESTQITTTGAQMLQPTSTLGGAADLVITANDDGSYTYVSTDAVYQSARFYNIAPITLKAGVSYTLSIDKELDVDIRVAGGGRIVAGETSVTFEPSADTLVDHVAIDRPTGYSGTNTVKVMLCEGTTAKPWEPYTGGQAAPCPDYPQEITDNLPAGDYYVPCATGGYWKVTLDAVMGGVPGYADTVEIDAYTGRYRLVRRTAVIVLDGNEAWAVGGKYLEDGTDWYYQTDQYVKRTVVIYRDESDLRKLGEIRFFAERWNVERSVQWIEGNAHDLPHEGTVSSSFKDIQKLMQIMEDYEAVFVSGVSATLRNGIVKYCVEKGKACYFVPHTGDVIIAGAEHIRSFSVPICRARRSRPTPEYLLVKRAMDIVLSLIAILIASPFMAITALAIWGYDHGPVLYKQVRLTKDGKPFEIKKFRSMRQDAERDGVARLASAHDDRITPIGRIIRAIRFDELPQLFNILKGDMSIVGPRPERPEIAEQYRRELPAFDLRLQVKAGLTGYAQVYGRYNTEPQDKLKMDLMYINHASIAEDIKLIFATVRILFMRESTSGGCGWTDHGECGG